jgi:hypothetical protein
MRWASVSHDVDRLIADTRVIAHFVVVTSLVVASCMTKRAGRDKDSEGDTVVLHTAR